MNFRVAGALAAVTTTFFAGQALAATVVLDSFTDEQVAVDAPFPGVDDTSTIAFGSGNRTMTAEHTGGTRPLAATVIQSGGGALSFSNRDGATGRTTLNYTMLGDISLGANPYFYFDVGYFDNAALFTVSAMDGGGGMSTYSEVVEPGFSPYLYFTSFSGTADFNDITSLTFALDTTDVPGYGPVVSVDGSLNEILIGADTPAPVPLPATALLLVAGVGGLGCLRSVLRRKAA